MPKNILEVISENIPFPEDFDMLRGKLTISIQNGRIEVVKQDKPEYGTSYFRGSYHPNVVCETSRGTSGPGICAYCGMTLFDSFNDSRE